MNKKVNSNRSFKQETRNSLLEKWSERFRIDLSSSQGYCWTFVQKSHKNIWDIKSCLVYPDLKMVWTFSYWSFELTTFVERLYTSLIKIFGLSRLVSFIPTNLIAVSMKTFWCLSVILINKNTSVLLCFFLLTCCARCFVLNIFVLTIGFYFQVENFCGVVLILWYNLISINLVEKGFNLKVKMKGWI